jgi:hypothetical protein
VPAKAASAGTPTTLTIAAPTGLRLDTRTEPGRFLAWVSSATRARENAVVIWEDGRPSTRCTG